MEAKKGWQLGPLVLLLKLGPKLLTVGGKLVKVLFGSKAFLAAASLASYAVLTSWQFAFVIVGSVFFHELGHVWAMKRAGMKVRGIYMIPFFGGAAVTESMWPTRGWQAVVALAGPAWGFVLALATYALYEFTGAPVIAAIAGWIALMNLFNLLPINPLDGGKTLGSIAYSLSSRLGIILMFLGLLSMGAIAWKFGFGLAIYMLLLGMMEFGQELRNYRGDKARQPIIAALAGHFGVPADAETVATCMAGVRVSGDGEENVRPEFRAVTDLIAGAYAAANNVNGKALVKGLSRLGIYSYQKLETTDGDNSLWVGGQFIAYLREKPMPKMSGKQVAVAGLSYAGLALALGAVLSATSHVPGADIAMEIFRH